MNRRIWIWITVVVVVVGVLLAIRYANTGGVKRSASQAPVVGTAQQGQPAPQFTAATNQGYFDLSKTNKPVFLEIFATWCPHCQRETAVIDKLYEKYKGRVAFVGVEGSNVGMDGHTPASQLDLLNFVQRFNVQYPVAFDGPLDIAHQYLQGGFPTMAVIAKDKTIAYLTSGETSFAELDAAIKRVL